MGILSAAVIRGVSLAAAFSAGAAMGRPADAVRGHTSQPWKVEAWVSLAAAPRVVGAETVKSPPALDAFGPVREEITVTQQRHVDDSAPLMSRIDASNPWSLDAAQPAVRNLQTFCEDKGPPSTVCFDMTQVPLRTRLLRLGGFVFWE